jgi:hypothetical protein
MHERNLFERRDIDIIVPVYKSVELAARCLDSLAHDIDGLCDCDPRLIAINDSPIPDRSDRSDRPDRPDRAVISVKAHTEAFAETLKSLVAVAYRDPPILMVRHDLSTS